MFIFTWNPILKGESWDEQLYLATGYDVTVEQSGSGGRGGGANWGQGQTSRGDSTNTQKLVYA